jgi:hypothetical protein
MVFWNDSRTGSACGRVKVGAAGAAGAAGTVGVGGGLIGMGGFSFPLPLPFPLAW